LLLANGRLLQGIISEEGSEYQVTGPVGMMRFPKKAVEGLFNSVREAYQYKLEQLPDRDTDERLKLARWCLSQKLTAEAKEQLVAILQVEPSHGPAKAMLVKLGQEDARAAFQRRDPDVQQTRGAPSPERQERPAALDPGVIGRAQSALGISSMPVIFDLPQATAIKRADEFYRYVHPLLQVHCAKCHNEQYDGPFQLVPIKTRLDRTPNALRHNLDAALALVNRDNPSKSELLTSTLRAHGNGPKPRPIYAGSNDSAYRVLAAWVSSLRAPRTEPAQNRAAQDQGPADQTAPFAADRSRNGQGPSDGASLPPLGADGRLMLAPGGAGAARIPPPRRLVPDLGAVIPDPDPEHPKEFPLPFVISGAKPPILPDGASPDQKKRGRPSSGTPSTAAASSRATRARPATTPPPGSLKPGAAGEAKKSTDQIESEDDATASKKSAKPVKMNATLLEQFLRNRNQSR
jgi:hypothetical protein